VYLSYREESNTAEDFMKFIARAIVDKYLARGDILICDNATVHDSAEILETLVMVLELLGIKLVYLPAYSPEFNPCELIFAQVKSYLRRRQRSYTDDMGSCCFCPSNANQCTKVLQ
jgi:transposase